MKMHTRDRRWLGSTVAAMTLLAFAGIPAAAQTPEAEPSVQAPEAEPSVVLQEEGALEDGDSVLESDGSLYDVYTFEGETGQSVTVNLSSSEFDTYLLVIDPAGQLLDQNDDAAQDDMNSSVTVTLPSDGTYTVVSNGFDSESRGGYAVEVLLNP